MNKNLTEFFIQKYAKGKKLSIHIKKKNRGKFTSYCGGKVTNACISKAKASGNPTLVKRATFAANARKWSHKNGGFIHDTTWTPGIGDTNSNLDIMKNDYVSPKKKSLKKKLIKRAQQGTKLLPIAIKENQPQVVQRYVALLDNGINAQPAFDTAHLSYTVEDNRPGKFYSFGKRSNNINTWQKQATDSLTIGRYKQLNNTTNFQQFKEVLKSKGYNTRPAFWNQEINRGRNSDKQKVNLFNKKHGLPLISGIIVNNDNMV